MKTVLIIILTIISYSSLHSQEILPRYLTVQEEAYIESGNYKAPNSFSTPPPSPVRVPAEWEEMQAVIITWQGFSSILSEIVEHLKDEVEVMIVCENQEFIQDILTTNGVDYSNNVSFHEIPSNSIWVRDYGPNSAYLEETGELVWIDWIYNRPRYQDDQVPVLLGEKLGIPVYESATAPEDLVNTGGNFMSDGMGTGFSSRLVLDENGFDNQFGSSNHDEEDVDELMNQFMGIDRYIKMDNLPFDLIHHIDMHMKIIDEETMIVGQYPEGIADGPQIEANIQYILSNFQTVYGKPYNIIRIPMPPENNGSYPNTGGDYRTYANALIANKTIILPTYQEKYDTTAIRIWEEAMPGYQVKGINCNNIIPLSGALHCITKEVAANNPIVINIEKIDTWCMNEPITIQAEVQSHIALNSIEIFYRHDINEDFISQEMEFIESNMYSYTFAGLEKGSSLEYYVKVKNEEGKEITRPLPGENGARKTSMIDCSVLSTSNYSDLDIEVYPNPASAITCIDLGEEHNRVTKIDLVDILGQSVGNFYIDNKDGAFAQKVFFDANSVQAGSYFLRISTGNGLIIKKISIH